MAGADWDAILSRLPAAARRPLWRRYADALNRRLLEAWLGTESFDRALKTDAYEEALGGGVADLLRQRARCLILADCSLWALRQARACRPGVRAVGCDVRALPFAGGGFDLIFSDSTLDHLPQASDILVALGELARVLRPGGRLILTLDNAANPVVRLRNALPQAWLLRARLTPYPVGPTLGPRALERALRQVGLAPLRRGALGHCPRLPAVLLCGLLGRGRLGRRLLRVLLAFERLESWPTRYLTGYYVAAEAVKR
jgi:SAM-dependent methyltransferase